MVSAGSLVSAAITLGPWIVPRVLAFYRSITSAKPSSIRPAPPKIQRTLNILFFAVLGSFILSFPYFSAPNIFTQTNSRLALPVNLLQARASARGGGLSSDDTLFFDRLESEGDKFRLIYAAYGADTALGCAYCSIADPKSYMYYSLPAIVLSHLLHIFLLGAVTSTLFAGREGARWRTHATLAGIALAAVEIYITTSYKWEDNGTKRMLGDVDFFSARMRTYRLLAFAATDAVLGWVLWLTSTNRWLARPPSTTEQLGQTLQLVNATRAQVNLLANLRNALVRDAGLRAEAEEYWTREGEEMTRLLEDDGVRGAVNSVLAREEYGQTERRARGYAEGVLGKMVVDVPAR